jgi:MFS family permease
MSLTLVAAAVGGAYFGWVADRYGRTRALSASILIYCIFTGLCAVVRSPLQLAIFRTLLGFGMGGEWAAGAVLVAETWPDEHRAKALAFVQSTWAIGYAIAAVLVGLVLPHWGWRSVFLVGIFPAVLAVWIRRETPEPELWQRRPERNLSSTSFFRGKLGRRALIAASMNSAALFAYWGLFFWVPSYLSTAITNGGRGLDVRQTSTWTLLMQVGGFLGYVSFGFIADSFGHRNTYVLFLFLAALAVPLYLDSSTAALLLIGPVTGFFAMGQFSGFGAITSGLFPTSVRGAALGLTYNIGRLVSAAAPFIAGTLSQTEGMRITMLMTSVAFAVAGMIALALPETRGRSLAAIN